MKVGCIGNMNNNFFSLTRFLRDKGVDAELVLLNTEQNHFMPVNDCYDDSYTAYTRSVSWGDIRSFNTPSEQIRRDLERYEVIICNSSTPAFLHKCGRRAEIFSPHGSDIFMLPFLREVHPSRYWLRNYRFAWSQRQGIRESKYLSLLPIGVPYEERIALVRPPDKRLFGLLPMVYSPIYNPQAITSRHGTTPAALRFAEIRQQSDIVVFHHVRHMWKKAVECPLTKGNDILVRGFAEFARSRPDIRSSLIMFEYGQDFPATKALVSELGIGHHVHWFPILPRKEIMIGLNLCDIASGEFHDGCIAGGVGQEVLVSGKPLLSYLDIESNSNYFDALPEIVNVSTAAQIRVALEDLTNQPERYQEIGSNGALWYERHCIERTIGEYLAVLRAAERSTGDQPQAATTG